ncbi:hypothetical protein [Shewanella youngdeokensis]|uniref:Uncharacterized protein n=1 Tax=Shewanella youngdeokensis TaxID=2999068 RepID=A0ABZ0JYD7_9GAMM|nr:hypothetical protein RGE70_14670 [Shewanella sp. DAU334]
MQSTGTLSAQASFIERENRSATPIDEHKHWSLLTNAQRFAFYTLTKLGYRLLFVRNVNQCSTAVASQENKLVTIDDEGDIDFNPSIVLRESSNR